MIRVITFVLHQIFGLSKNHLVFSADGTCDGVQCHDNATCFKTSAEKPGQCVCKDGWQGDGKTCEGQKKKRNHLRCNSLISFFRLRTYL